MYELVIRKSKGLPALADGKGNIILRGLSTDQINDVSVYRERKRKNQKKLSNLMREKEKEDMLKFLKRKKEVLSRHLSVEDMKIVRELRAEGLVQSRKAGRKERGRGNELVWAHQKK